MEQMYVTLVVVALLAVVAAEKTSAIEQCPGEHHEDLLTRVTVVPCGRSRCKLHKGSNITVTFLFKTTHEVAELKNNVWGEIGGVALPYPGVDQVTVCGHVTHLDGSPAPCPLEAGREYRYIKLFPIENYYPETALRVHWSLNDGKSNVICFEAPAVIRK